MITKATCWVSVTQEAIDDGEQLRGLLHEMFRRAELAARGFLGYVRCDRCHRRIRCVYVVGNRRYGRGCAAAV